MSSLIVEDNFIIRCSLKAMLLQLGYSADYAEDGKTALALYHSNYAFILMDVNLPDFSGIEVAKTIRKIEKRQQYPNIPIIAITSHSDEIVYQEGCIKAGMNACSSKPNLMQLKKWISEYLLERSVN
jgi:CheY-like chemotaxis protein